VLPQSVLCANVCACVCALRVAPPVFDRTKERKGEAPQSNSHSPDTSSPRMMEPSASLALQQGLFCSSFSTSTFSPGKKQDGDKEKKEMDDAEA
jgi:hypothetical protein